MKDNQPKTKARIFEKLAPRMLELEQGRMSSAGLGKSALSYAEQTDKGHGRLEHRQWLGTPVDEDSLDWPFARQAGLVRRMRTIKGKTSVEYAAYVTSLDPRFADGAALLNLSRGHWSIENSLHYVRDVSFAEDASLIHSGNAPANMAALRNLVITLLNDAGHTNKAAATRRYAAQCHEAIALARGP